MKKIFIFIILISISSLAFIKATTIYNTKLIYLDAGHGGMDGGTSSTSGIIEKDVNLKVVNYLKKYLEESNYIVKLTRENDDDLSSDDSDNKKKEDIHKRVKMINESSCILYVSIHANSYSSSYVRGAQVFYNPSLVNNKILSEDIQSSIKNILNNSNRTAKPIKDKYLIDNTKKVGCLVEVGFLSNKEEAKLLENEYYLDKMAYAIYLGIIEYINKINNI